MIPIVSLGSLCMSLRSAIKRTPWLYALVRPFHITPTQMRRIFVPSFTWRVLSTVFPISLKYGLDRGKPIDRLYIEEFLSVCSLYIRGVCLEIKDNTYTTHYGGVKVVRSDILDINSKNSRATIVDDLRALKTIRDNYYDCIILTQVLQFIDDVDAAVKQCYRVLKPGGTLLVTVPSLSRIDIGAGTPGDFWRFTSASISFLFGKYFSSERVTVQSWGNVLAGVGFWIGLAVEDLSKEKLGYHDDNFPIIISVCAIK